MKRLISLTLSVFMLMLSVVPAVPASAQVSDGIRTSASEVTRDGTFTVEIVVPPSAVKADTMSVRVDFDSDAFEVESWTSGVAGATNTPVLDCDGFFSATYGSATANLDYSSGIVMTAEMRVKSTAPLDEYTFRVSESYLGFYDSLGVDFTQTWTAAVTEAKVTVKEATVDEENTVVSGGLSLSSYEVSTGDEIYAYINIPALKDKADTLSLRVNYDSTAFEVESWTSNIIGATDTPVGECNGSFSATFGSSTKAVDLSEGVRCVAKLRVKDEAMSTAYPFTLTRYEISYCDDNGIDYHRLWRPVDTRRTVQVTSLDPDRIPVVGGGVSVSDSDLQPGDSFYVYVTIPSIRHKADTATIYVSYDNSTFDLVSWKGLDGATNTDPSVVGSRFGTTYANSDADIDLNGGKVFTAEMKVKDTATKGNYSFGLIEYDLVYFDDDNVEHSVWTPSVYRAPVSIGDDPYPVTKDGISASTSTASLNDTFKVYVKVPVIAKNAENINLKVTFDENIFAVTSCEPQIPGATTTIGNGYFSVVSDKPVDLYLGGGLTLTATVRVKSSAVGNYDIRLSSHDLSYNVGTQKNPLWTPLTEKVTVTVNGGSNVDDTGAVHGGGIYVSSHYVRAGETFNVYVNVPAIGTYADTASFSVNYDPSAFTLVSWNPYIYGGTVNKGYGYFGLTASNIGRSIDLTGGRTFTATLQAKSSAYTGNYTFGLSGNGFTYLKANGYEWQRLWVPDTYYAYVNVYYGSTRYYVDTSPVITTSSPYAVTSVTTSGTTTGRTQAPVTVPSASDTTARPDDDDPIYTIPVSEDDANIALNVELDGLSNSRVLIKTKKKFFANDVIVILRRTIDSANAASYALRNLGLENNAYYAFDISVYDAVTGNYIHSLGQDGYITFDIPVPTSLASDLSSLRLYHIDGNYPQRIETTIIYENGVQKIRFTVNSFSPYMFVGGKSSGGGGMIDPSGTKVDPGSGNANPHTGVAAAVIIPAAVTGCVVLARKQSKRRRGRK